VLHSLAHSKDDRFTGIVWLSSRDIDLLPQGRDCPEFRGKLATLGTHRLRDGGSFRNRILGYGVGER
jgi:hypothetical protein